MLVDLDLLLKAVLCTADDLLPGRGKNAYVVWRRTDRGALGCARRGAVSRSSSGGAALSNSGFWIGGES